MNFPGRKPEFHGETYVPNFLAIRDISYVFSYRLATYYWKGLKESYNIVVGSNSIRTHMQKL
jgi:hypothetical protein